MQFKDARARFDVKDAEAGDGTFEALVSVFGNVDAAGDRVMPGAFTKSIERWKASGDPVPIVYSHAHRDPQALLGGVLDMRETNEGLWVKGALELSSPVAALVHRHMKSRTLRKFSFAYDVLGSHPSRKDGGVLELTELDIIEVGPTLIPANSEAALLTVKAEGEPPSREVVLTSREVDRLIDAIDSLKAALSPVEERAEGDTPDRDDEEERAPAARPPVAQASAIDSRRLRAGVAALYPLRTN